MQAKLGHEKAINVFSKIRRSCPWPSLLFNMLVSSFENVQVYSYGHTSVGKSVPTFTNGAGRKTNTWPTIIHSFENSRQDLCISLVYFIIFLVYVTYNKKNGPVVAKLVLRRGSA